MTDCTHTTSKEIRPYDGFEVHVICADCGAFIAAYVAETMEETDD